MAKLKWLTSILLASCWAGAAHCKSTTGLADLALRKVLADASQIFGIYDYGARCGGRPPASEWMGRHPDSMPLAQLNIPGAHDTATWNFSRETRDSLAPDAGVRDPAYYRTQTLSPADALDAGLRFFDLRYALDPTGTTLVFWHHDALLSAVAGVEDVLFAFYAWLDGHPSEAVILSFQYEGGTMDGASNNADVQTRLFDILTSEAARRYILQTRDELGTLGEARGKIVLFRRFDTDRLPPGYDAGALPGLHLAPGRWPDNSADFGLVYNDARNLTAYIEDYYEPDDLPIGLNASVNIARKLDATTAHLDKAASSFPDSLFITFASGEHNDNVPPVFPEIMALGNGTEDTPLGGVNQQLASFLGGMGGKRLGIVVLDYWNQPSGLVDAILAL
ncbi:PLC-like phosphodiesterase [Phialemonium atrogriseum]|uniref:PLC-like phosphodiesterase n=1 Tax=Phialemonium atrogriseum TaxID=1093897 RepID=A0AAJ0C306_9PEZI|nr:PLC-like phosphodiesterase [Phialemonium atrogriseum]KAK1769209.1 PLC-like phosphodiesterase [Phialemonium atrogriseum]